MGQYVALIRGINVGGNHLIRMVELKACFEELGVTQVTTYIQSGNVLFETKATATDRLAHRIETALAKAFDCQTTVVLRSRKQMRDVVEFAPKGFGSLPAKFRYDVIFLKEPLTSTDAIASIPTKPGVDQAHTGTGVLYFSRLTSKATQSRLSKIVSLPIYKHVTIRNWNTTTQIVQLMSTAPLRGTS